MMIVNKYYPTKNNSFVIPSPSVSSLTLFGALANCYASLYGNENFKNYMNLFENNDLAISSLFPALRIKKVEDEKTDNEEIEFREILFLPKPYIEYDFEGEKIGESESSLKKKMRTVKWLSMGVMELLSSNIKKREDSYYHGIDFINNEAIISIGNEFLCASSELPKEFQVNPGRVEKIKPYSQYATQRVMVPRFSDESQPFSQEELSFINTRVGGYTVQAFLYFLENGSGNDKHWIASKQLLVDEGIGGKRSLGKGCFENLVIEEYSISKETGSNPDIFLLLSALIPEKKELSAIASYDTGIDDGFITFGRPLIMKKGAVHFIRPGAVITNSVQGKMLEQVLGSDSNDKIYRYGKAFLLPLAEVTDE